MNTAASYKNHRISPQIIARAVWLCFRFPLRLRLAEKMLSARGIVVSFIEPSVGSVGNGHDNALTETINGPYKVKVIHRRGPWRNFEAVEFATFECVDWFNNRSLLESIGNTPPAYPASSTFDRNCAARGLWGALKKVSGGPSSTNFPPSKKQMRSETSRAKPI
jgi:hypothetical protein